MVRVSDDPVAVVSWRRVDGAENNLSIFRNESKDEFYVLLDKVAWVFGVGVKDLTQKLHGSSEALLQIDWRDDPYWAVSLESLETLDHELAVPLARAIQIRVQPERFEEKGLKATVRSLDLEQRISDLKGLVENLDGTLKEVHSDLSFYQELHRRLVSGEL